MYNTFYLNHGDQETPEYQSSNTHRFDNIHKLEDKYSNHSNFSLSLKDLNDRSSEFQN